MIYHLLHEPFSAVTGLGVAGVVANLMRQDDNSVVVSDEADDTWGFGPNRILVIPQLSLLSKSIGWRFLPMSITRTLICRVCEALTARLEPDDVVWCHNGPYTAAALARTIHLKGARLIYHSHNSFTHYKKRPVLRSFAPDAMIFNSDAMRQEALTFFPELKNTHVVHNGANEALFYPAPGDTVSPNPVPVILYVGRLVPFKGAHVLIEAMRILHQRNVDAVCKIVGSSHAGGRKSKVTPYVKTLLSDHPPNVQFVGYRTGTEIAQEYRTADILCCPSIWQEPFGTVNVEAMACRVPVVASRVGGIPEIASEGGILMVEPDSAAQLADALEKLVLDRGLRERMADEGRASFQRRFTWRAIMSRHRSIIEAL